LQATRKKQYARRTQVTKTKTSAPGKMTV
jgi:hypothetical protein